MNHSWRGRAFFLVMAMLIMAWSSIPNWRGKSLENQEVAYIGTFYDAPDFSVHVAMMRTGMQGDWSYGLRFTTENHEPKYLRLFYIALGQLNRILNLEPELLFHLARWLVGLWALYALIQLMRRVFSSSTNRWSAFFLVVMGAGFGFLQLAIGSRPGAVTPVDLWLIDAYVFFSLALFPHFAFTLALMAFSLSNYLDFMETGSWTKIAVIVVSAWLVQLVNPIAFLTVDVFVGGLSVFSWWRQKRLDLRQLIALLVLALMQVPLLVYNYLPFMYDPIWSRFTEQNKTLSPPPEYYLWGFGLFWILGMAGMLRAVRERNPIMLACALWIITAFSLAYVPVGIQRRFLMGITIPFGIISTYALQWMGEIMGKAPEWARQRIPAFSVLLILFMSMSSILLTPSYAIFLQRNPDRHFYPRTLDHAFEWIEKNTNFSDFVLEGDPRTGLLIAQKTGRRVYVGHQMETLHYEDKLKTAGAFYSGELDRDWLNDLPLQWVLYGPYEQALARDFVPGPELLLAWEGKGVRIYQVKGR